MADAAVSAICVSAIKFNPALFEMGEELPDPHEATDIAPEVSDEEQTPGPISFEAAKAAKDAEAVTPVVDTHEEEQAEDTRQEWEKPLAEVEAEQQPKRRGRPPKADKAEQGPDTCGQQRGIDKVCPKARWKDKIGLRKSGGRHDEC